MRVLCPAKVNLHLRVGPRRADGFHPLMSWMATVGFFDKLEFERTRGADQAPGADDLTLRCDRPDLPVDQDNLVLKAARALRDARSRRLEGSAGGAGGWTVRLEKRIPVGAGLGGGSSDAARTLIALNRLWQLGLSLNQLHAVAQTLGSDVPFFLHEPSAICTGRGEHVRPIAPPRPRWIVLIFPPYGLSTPAVYREFDRMKLGDAGAIEAEPNWPDWASADSEQLLPRLVNDLEPAAFAVQPDLGILRARIEQHLGRIVRMSGSGSSLFTMYDDATAASRGAGEVQGAFPGAASHAVELCPTLADDLAANAG